MMASSIENLVTEGLINPTIDLTTDYAELALDAFLDNEAIKEIPIVKTIVGFTKGAIKIKEIFFAKKLLIFLQEFHKGNIDPEKYNDFKKKFEQEEKYRKEVVEQIVIFNERFVSGKKSAIYANLFNAHICNLIDWNDFLTISAMLDNLYLESLSALVSLSKEKRPYFANKPPLPPSMILLLYSGLVLWMHDKDKIITTHFGMYMHLYGIEAKFELTRQDLYNLMPLEVRA